MGVNLELVLRSPDGTEIAVVKYDAEKYLKVLALMNRPQMRPQMIDDGTRTGTLMINPATPGQIVGLKVIQLFDSFVEQEEQLVRQAEKIAAQPKPGEIGDIVQIKADVTALLGG